jgi:glycerol-3-phosphate dehydrogenase
MTGSEGFTVTPRRGELIVFDKLSRPLVNHIILPVPTGKTKGVLVAPTVFGNVLLGPTADDIDDKRDTASTASGLARLRAMGSRIMPELLEHEVTAVFAGLRAATEHSDYQLDLEPDRRYLWAGGIRSTGLTASMAIAEWVVDRLGDAGLRLEPAAIEPAPPRMANLGEAFLRPYQDADAIARDPAYGEVVCFCERVTAGEIRDAMAGDLPPHDLDGLRRRTRALTGRCQGFFCGARVSGLLEDRRAAGPSRGST